MAWDVLSRDVLSYIPLKLFSGSNSHFIFNNCLLGYCHQSDKSKLPQVISDLCKRINTE